MHSTIALSGLRLGVVVFFRAEVVSFGASLIGIVFWIGVRISAIVAIIKPTSGFATVIICQI